MITYHKLFNKPSQFKRFTGLTIDEFNLLVKRIKPLWIKKEAKRLSARRRLRKMGAGHPYHLKSLEDKILMMLVFYRSYVTYCLLGYLFDFDASNACRLVLKLTPLVSTAADPKINEFMRVKKPRRIGTIKELIETYPEYLEIIIDATEQEVKKPSRVRRKNRYRSGKVKHHTLKTQVTINDKGRILHVSKSVPGRMHDKALLDQSKVLDHIPKRSKSFLDRGYEGERKSHPTLDIRLPYKRYWKRPDRGKLTRGQRQANTLRSKRRIVVEHVISHLKKFQILSQTYRSSIPLYGKHIKNIAALLNLRHEFVLNTS